MGIDKITEGFYNKLLDKKKDLHLERMKICKECKLYKTGGVFGPICNRKLYLNPETNEVSKTKREGFGRGCGCVLDAKTRVENATCPLLKW